MTKLLDSSQTAATPPWKLLLDSVPALIAYWDKEQRNVLANSAYNDWLGISPDKMTGLHARDVLGAHLYEQNLPYISAALRGEKQSFCRALSGPAGDVRHVHVSYVPDIVSSEVVGFYVLVDDATELVKAQHSLTKANQLKSDILAMLSHDLRQPLASVMLHLDVLEKGWSSFSDDKRLRYISDSIGAIESMSVMMNDLLTMVNLDSGTITCRPQEVRLYEALDGLLHDIAHGQQLDLECEDDIVILVDPTHLRQIMVNLVGNATKYGAPPITVSARRSAGGIALQVRDEGAGVPPEFVPRLFERFARADETRDGEADGTGFGLYIVRNLAQLNDGGVTYSHGIPRGAVFTVTFPTGGSPRSEHSMRE